MLKTNTCPKCHSQNILKIKDTLHANGAGNISYAKHMFIKSNCAFITYYICKDCGYIEEYLDQEELKKLL